MRWEPLKLLLVVTLIQMALSVTMAYSALRLSVVQDRTANLYAGYLSLQSDTNSPSSARSFVSYASKTARDADRGFTRCAFLAILIGVVAIMQLWLIVDAFRLRNSTRKTISSAM